MNKKESDKNWLEWSITIISGILVFFVLGFLVYQLIYEEQTPPDITVVFGEVVEKDGGFAISIEGKNEGTITAENVVIEIETSDSLEKETAEVNFAFLPGKSSAKGWIIFDKKPNPEKLKTKVKGYTTP